MKTLPELTFNEKQSIASEMEEILKEIHDALTDKERLSVWDKSVIKAIEGLYSKTQKDNSEL